MRGGLATQGGRGGRCRRRVRLGTRLLRTAASRQNRGTNIFGAGGRVRIHLDGAQPAADRHLQRAPAVRRTALHACMAPSGADGYHKTIMWAECPAAATASARDGVLRPRSSSRRSPPPRLRIPCMSLLAYPILPLPPPPCWRACRAPLCSRQVRGMHLDRPPGSPRSTAHARHPARCDVSHFCPCAPTSARGPRAPGAAPLNSTARASPRTRAPPQQPTAP